MAFNPFVQLYIYINIYAFYIGCALIFIALLATLLKRKRLSKLLKITSGVMAILGVYLILWNFRIINVPYRSPDTTMQDKAQQIKIYQTIANRVDFKTFNLSYKPAYLRSLTTIYSVLSIPQNQTEHIQVNIELIKYLKGPYINSEVVILSEDKPILDIRQESTRGGSCTSAYKLNDYTVIGKNDAGGEILRATNTTETAYLTDFMGTRLVLENCSLTGNKSLSDNEVLKMFHNLVPFDIHTADFNDPRM